MRVLETRLDGPLLIEPITHRDERGFFQESFRAEAYVELGIAEQFVQDNHSRSGRGVVRGMHFAIGAGASKLVRCARGEILDVLVDVRRDSPTFGEWEVFELDDQSLRQVYVPVGFAHGFCVLSAMADVLYKQSTYYDPAIERGFAYDDPDVAISWPVGLELLPSPRDAAAPRLRDVRDELPFRFEA